MNKLKVIWAGKLSAIPWTKGVFRPLASLVMHMSAVSQKQNIHRSRNSHLENPLAKFSSLLNECSYLYCQKAPVNKVDLIQFVDFFWRTYRCEARKQTFSASRNPAINSLTEYSAWVELNGHVG